MKADIHPQWHEEAQVVCACGNMFVTGSTKSEIRVEICSRCHPFYSGATRYADKEGNVNSFIKKMKKAQEMAPILAKKKAKGQKVVVVDNTPKSLKEMLLGLQ